MKLKFREPRNSPKEELVSSGKRDFVCLTLLQRKEVWRETTKKGAKMTKMIQISSLHGLPACNNFSTGCRKSLREISSVAS